ncbi:MAG: hypothetical protein K2F97_04930 [Muribaculaceae bacterium]|nr:hypothetical protein [Muribaculaceae bacterium]
MKHLLAIFFAMASLLFVACNDEPEVAPTQLPVHLPILERDSVALVWISKMLDTEARDYPVRWSPADRSTWKEIRLDTITDEATGKQFLAVGALTIYQTHEGELTPLFISDLKYIKDLRIYGCRGAIIDCLPRSLKSLLIDRLDPDEKYYMDLNNDNVKLDIITNSTLSDLTIHGLRISEVYFRFLEDSRIDLSDNTLEGCVLSSLGFCLHVNLSHNNYRAMDWTFWTGPAKSVPDLQGNNIEIPDDIIDTNFWRENHEKFIGNPGYRAPAD